MKIANFILLLSQIAIVSMFFMLWPVEPPHELQDSNCSPPVGRPESLELNGQIYRYRYDAKGRVLSRRGEFEEIRFQYVWQHDHPIHITRSYGQEGQPEWVRLEWHFIFNKNFDMVYARDSDGRDAWYGINDNHELMWVKNTNGLRMDVEYDPVCHQPSKLSQAGVGSLSLAYDGECNIIGKSSGDQPNEDASFLYRFNSSLKLILQANMDLFH